MIHVREMGPLDVSVWAEMRARLWPECSAVEHTTDIAEILGSDDY
jgi:hypothetical protein